MMNDGVIRVIDRHVGHFQDEVHERFRSFDSSLASRAETRRELDLLEQSPSIGAVACPDVKRISDSKNVRKFSTIINTKKSSQILAAESAWYFEAFFIYFCDPSSDHKRAMFLDRRAQSSEPGRSRNRVGV